ncbi:MAG: Ig-like domain-containing protein [Gemmatimonadota bacterium]
MRRLIPIILMLAACGEDAVTPPDLTPVATVVFTASQDTLILSESVTLSAAALGAAGDTLPGRQVTWTSSVPAVASVSLGGAVTALTPGTATITATIGGVDANLPITVRSLQFTSIRPGSDFTCGLTVQGEAWCWGGNAYGQLGLGTADPQALVRTPHRVGTTTHFTAIETGFGTVCGVVTGGTVSCWGYNAFGQLGDGSTTDRWAPVPVAGLTSATALSVQGDHTCAVAGSQTFCWGDNASGQLGDGSRVQRLTPVAVVGAPALTAIRTSAAWSCGLTGAGQAWCWGDNTRFELGFDTVYYRAVPAPVSGGQTYTALTVRDSRSCGLRSSGVADCWGFRRYGESGIQSNVPTPDGGAIGYSSIDQGQEHACGLDAQGHAWCWGANDYGQLGSGVVGQSSVEYPATAVTGGLTFTSISAGGYHTCGVTSTGAAWCWGDGFSGVLGDGSTGNSVSPVPVPVAGGHVFDRISAGGSHTCAITTTDAAWCWGANNAGQLGDSSSATRFTPAGVAGGLAFSRLDLANDLTCGLTTAGAVYCWGFGGNSGLGNGQLFSKVPVDVSGGNSYTAIAAGPSHSCAITTGGAAYCWGDNLDGELGDGTTTQRLTPVPVSGGATYTDIAVGQNHSCARTTAGQIECWGTQYSGTLGDGVFTDSPLPLAVAGGLNFGEIATGYSITGYLSCGLVAGGDPYCWPFNNSRTPILYPGGIQFTSLRGGDTMLCGVAVGGAGYCWGFNDAGQLGTGSVSLPGTGFSRPQALTGGLQFASIAAGSQHACGITTGGVAYCWGNNYSGQLGAAGALLAGVPYPVKVMGQP